MRLVHGDHLWLGDAGDLRTPGVLELQAIEALVHLALEELLPPLSRELLVCHFPLMDGMNRPDRVAAALETTASLIRTCTPTLVCCSAGMSRSPCIAAGALALATGKDATVCLERIVAGHPHDVSPGMWDGVLAYLHG